MPVTFSIFLQAYFVDNNALARNSTHIDVRIEESTYLSIESDVSRNDVQATYRVLLTNARLVGHPKLPELEWVDVVAVALSLCCRRVLLSPVLLVANEPVIRKPGFSGTVTARLTSPNEEIISEPMFAKYAGQLVKLRGMNTLEGINLQEAVASYREALYAVETRTRFTHLWAALEKSCSWDGRPQMLDEEVSALTGLAATEVAVMRETNNRLKHASRSLKDVANLQAIRNIASVSRDSLLLSVNKLIASRLEVI